MLIANFLIFYSILYASCNLVTPPLPESAGLVDPFDGVHNSTSITYNKRREICCDGSVYTQPDAFTNVACCGSSQYSTNKEVCCGSTSYPIRPNHVCCGNKYHSPREMACCYHPYNGNAFLVLIAPGTEEYVLCCGIRAYDTRTHICCTIEMSETGPVRPGSNQFVDRVTRFIVYDRKFRHSACCKGKVYDAESGACADLQLTSRSLWTRLRPDRTHPIGICGHQTYDTKTQWCCSGVDRLRNVWVHRVSALPCCELKSYDQETHVCCGGVIHVQNEFGSLLCCDKGGLYDARYQECCDSSYNVIPSRHIYNRGDMCCGQSNTPYHSHRQACCADTVVDVPQSVHGDYRCCINPHRTEQVVLYLRDEEICCNGIKYLLTAQHSHCCGQDAYSPKKMVCCDGKLFIKKSEFDSCCGPNLYNGQSQLCCGRENWSEMKRDVHRRACCIDQIFGSTDKRKDCTCDVDQPHIHPRLARTNACCRLELFDTRTQRCCNGKVIDRYLKLCCLRTEENQWEPTEHIVNKASFNSECCGTSSYNPHSQICCNNTLAAYMGLDDLGCCGSAVYNRQTQMCCKLKILEKQMGTTSCCGSNLYDLTTELCCEKTETILPLIPGEEEDSECCYKE